MNETKNNRYASISNSITTVKLLRAQWTHSCQDIWSRSLYLFNDAFSNSSCVSSHELVNGGVKDTRKKLAQPNQSTIHVQDPMLWQQLWLHRTCHHVVTQVLYTLQIWCLKLKGRAVKQEWLFLGLLDPADKTQYFFKNEELFNKQHHAMSSTIQQMAGCCMRQMLHQCQHHIADNYSTNGTVPHPRQLFNQWYSTVPHPKFLSSGTTQENCKQN